MVDYSIYLDVSRQDCQFALAGPRKGENNARRLIILPMAALKTMDISAIAAVHFHLRTPSGTEYSSECTVEGGCIVHTLTGGESAEAGEAYCEVRFQDAEGTVLFSPQFRIVFSESLFDSAAAPSEETTEWTQLIGRVAKVEDGKVDKVEGATEGHLAVFDGEGGIKDGGAVPSGGGSGGGSVEVAANIYTLKYAEPDADPGYWTSATNPELFAALDAIKSDIAAGKDIAVLMDVNPSSGYNTIIHGSANISGGSIEVRGRLESSGTYYTYKISRSRNADKVYLSKFYSYEDDINNVGSVANAPTVNFVVDLVKKELGESGESWPGSMTKLASGTIASGTAANTKTDTGVKYSHFKVWHRLVFMRKSSVSQGTFSNGYGYGNNAGFRDAHAFLSVVLTHIDGYLWHYRYFATDTVVYGQPTDAVRTGTTGTLWSEGLGSTSNCDISEGYLDIRSGNQSRGFTDDNTFQIKNWSELTADVSWSIYALTLEG